MILTGCHATGAESVYIRKFVTEEKHLPYIAIDTDSFTADQGQIATRLTAFLEMIQPGTDEHLDINYCYKIVLDGTNEAKVKSRNFGRNMEIYAYSGKYKSGNKKQKNGLESAGKKQNRNVEREWNINCQKRMEL